MINDVQNISGNRNPDRKEPKKWKNFALLLGPIMFCVLQFVEPPKTLSPEAFEILSVAIWMAIWWVSEAVPIAVTALLPIVLFPLTGALTLTPKRWRWTFASYPRPIKTWPSWYNKGHFAKIYIIASMWSSWPCLPYMPDKRIFLPLPSIF